MSKSSVVPAIIALTAVIVLASAAVPSEARLHADVRSEVTALSAEPMNLQICISCIACDGARSHKMEFLDDPETDDRGISHHCDTGYDHECTYHPPCVPDGLSAEELGKLWVAVSTFKGHRLQGVLKEYKSVVTYNPGRRAVQFSGSCGAIIGHLPLSQAQIASL